MAEHYLVVHQDERYLAYLAEHNVEITEEIREESWATSIECSDSDNCPGWQECDSDHSGFDPNDEDSPAYSKYEDVEIHGEMHEWRAQGWCVAFPGCPVVEREDGAEGDYDPSRPGRYLLDVDWDDTLVYLTVIREVDRG